VPTVKDFGSFKVRIHPGDHNPPHVHVVGPEFETIIRIRDAVPIRGDALPRAVARRVAAFISRNRDRLMAEWNRAADRRTED
jgi:hypothetical protein